MERFSATESNTCNTPKQVMGIQKPVVLSGSAINYDKMISAFISSYLNLKQISSIFKHWPNWNQRTKNNCKTNEYASQSLTEYLNVTFST